MMNYCASNHLKLGSRRMKRTSQPARIPLIIDQLRAAVVLNCATFARKDYDEFQKMVEDGAEMFGLVTTLGQEERYDTVITAAVSYLAVVADQKWNKHYFESEDALRTMC